MFPKSTHETFSQKLYQTFKVHKRFVKPKLSRTDFTIAHYAGEVWIMHFVLYIQMQLVWGSDASTIFLVLTNSRFSISLINFWTKIKTMLSLNIKIC